MLLYLICCNFSYSFTSIERKKVKTQHLFKKEIMGSIKKRKRRSVLYQEVWGCDCCDS